VKLRGDFGPVGFQGKVSSVVEVNLRVRVSFLNAHAPAGEGENRLSLRPSNHGPEVPYPDGSLKDTNSCLQKRGVPTRVVLVHAANEVYAFR
jgi:hypothetical protein